MSVGVAVVSCVTNNSNMSLLLLLLIVSIPPPLTCDIRGCAHCGTSSCCSMCEDGFTNHRSDPCACGNGTYS